MLEPYVFCVPKDRFNSLQMYLATESLKLVNVLKN